MTLYDYIYVDLEKVVSLYSQLTGGVVELRESNRERVYSADNKRKYDFKVFKHDAGGTDEDKTGVKEVIKPHHAVLTALEQELTDNGYLIDLTNPLTMRSLRDLEFRQQLKNALCLKVRGRAVVEDYERIKSIAQGFPEVAQLINRSKEANLKETPQFLEIQAQIEQLERDIEQTKERNVRNTKQQELKTFKKSLNNLLINATNIGVVDQWVLDGLKTWIDTFLPGIVNLRIYPSSDRPDEHIFGHLKKDCFEDTDTNSFHFTYGSVPTEHLTMIGIVTSVPDESGDNFNPLIEFNKDSVTEYESVENGFRGVFRGFDGMERTIRTCRFPRVLVHPITVYRSVEPSTLIPAGQKLARR